MSKNDDVQSWAASIGWKVGKSSGMYIRSGFGVNEPGYGMMSPEAMANLYEQVWEASIAKTIRLRNLIRQQGTGSWQRVFESEVGALKAQNTKLTDKEDV